MAVRLTTRSRRSWLHGLALPALLLLPLALFASAATLALPTAASASTVTFTYGSFHNGYPDPTTSWYDARNWSPEQVPRAEDDVILPDGEPVPSDYTGGTLRSLNASPTGFHVYGSLTLTAGTSSFSPYTTDLDGTLTVAAGATLIVQGDYNNVSGADTVVNYGTIVGHDVGYPHPTIGSPVYNHGTLTCDAGTLLLYEGGVSYTGSVIGGGDGIVQLFNYDPYVEVDWTLQGGCDVVGGTEISDIVSVPGGETVSFTGINAVDIGGGLYGPGTFRVEPGSTLGLGGYGSYDDGLTLDNDGTLVVGDCDPYQWQGGTRIDNSGTLHLAIDYRGLGVDTSEGRATLLNTGTILSDATDPYIDMALDNRGTIRVAGGSLMLGALQNYDVLSRTLDGGSYEVKDGGVLRIAEADIAHLAARVTLTGAD